MGDLRTERMPNFRIGRSKKNMGGNPKSRGQMTWTAVVAHEMNCLLQEQFGQIGVAYWLDEFNSFVKGEIDRMDFLFKFFIRLPEGKDDATFVVVGKPSLSLPDKNAQWYIFFSGTASGM